MHAPPQWRGSRYACSTPVEGVTVCMLHPSGGGHGMHAPPHHTILLTILYPLTGGLGGPQPAEGEREEMSETVPIMKVKDG